MPVYFWSHECWQKCLQFCHYWSVYIFWWALILYNNSWINNIIWTQWRAAANSSQNEMTNEINGKLYHILTLVVVESMVKKSARVKTRSFYHLLWLINDTYHLGCHHCKEFIEVDGPGVLLVYVGDHLLDLLLLGFESQRSHCHLEIKKRFDKLTHHPPNAVWWGMQKHHV